MSRLVLDTHQPAHAGRSPQSLQIIIMTNPPRRFSGSVLLAPFVIALLLPGSAAAHPIGIGIYERTAAVRLSRQGAVVVFRLDIFEATAVKDLLNIAEKKELEKLNTPAEHYEAFARIHAPIFARNLTATLDGKPLEFTCTEQRCQTTDHLRCDFLFEAKWRLTPGTPHRFTIREDNYDSEAGMVRLTLAGDSSVHLLQKVEPDEQLRARTYSDLKPGDEDRMRRASATFELVEAASAEAGPTLPESADEDSSHDTSLMRLFLNSRRGFALLLLLAAGLGAAHALTPGHGKTLVAAYLVGERGTVWHALVLGLVTTVTHTGVVLILAAVLYLYFGNNLTAGMQQSVERSLGLVGGGLIAALGVWLLFRRLLGQADHFHLPGQGHHHHNPHDHEHVHALPKKAGFWGMIVLGIQGGIVPCWDAVVLLMTAVTKNLLELAVPMLLAFSAGLAAVLIAIGIVVVKAHGLAGARWSESRWFKALPLVSALLVTALGLWLCYDSLHPRALAHPISTRP